MGRPSDGSHSSILQPHTISRRCKPTHAPTTQHSTRVKRPPPLYLQQHKGAAFMRDIRRFMLDCCPKQAIGARLAERCHQVGRWRRRRGWCRLAGQPHHCCLACPASLLPPAGHQRAPCKALMTGAGSSTAPPRAAPCTHGSPTHLPPLCKLSVRKPTCVAHSPPPRAAHSPPPPPFPLAHEAFEGPHAHHRCSLLPFQCSCHAMPPP